MRKLLALVFSVALLAISIVALLSVTRSITTPANAAPNPIEIISISELSSTSVEILFSSSVPKKSLSYFVINAVVDSSVGMPKNIKKTIKTKATGLITTQIKNLNPKASYKFTVSAKTNKAKMINSAAVEYSSLSILMDALSNLPSEWGNPKPIQIPAATPSAAPVVLPAFTLTSSTETRTVNTAATGFTTNSTGSVITSFAINATPSGMSFNTTTGALTGTPNTVAAATTYTITATNSSGSATQTFTLTVAIAAPAFSISSSSETKSTGSAIIGYTITSTGGTIASYAISPAAPAGLTFSTSTGLLSGTPTVAGATAYTITATNATGSATQTFTLTVTVGAALKVAVTQASVGTSPGVAFTTQPQITIQDLGGNTITSSTAVVTATVSTGGTLVGTATATASSGVATFSNLGIRGFGATAYTITYTAAGLTTATQSVTPSALIVGNTGPGGGKIFYVATSAGFNCGPTTTEKCYYLETAPTTGTNLWTDAQYAWSGNTTVEIGATARGTAIGTGYANTLAIVGQSGLGNTATRAGTISRAYGGPNSLSDWFLPSVDELNQMCKWARGITGGDLITLTTRCTGGTSNTELGFVQGFYLSSTEFDNDEAFFQILTEFIPAFLTVGFEGRNWKEALNIVRPIRSF